MKATSTMDMIIKKLNTKIVYHGSPIGNLKVIYPHISTHGKNYVYATEYKEMAFIYMQHWNDFILNVSFGKDGILEITERYMGAIDELYKGKNGYLYELCSDNFVKGLTGFEGEMISDKEEMVIHGTYIDDALSVIEELNKKGNIRIRYYPDKPDYIPYDDSDLVQEAINIYNHEEKNVISYCIEKHPDLKEALNNFLSAKE